MNKSCQHIYIMNSIISTLMVFAISCSKIDSVQFKPLDSGVSSANMTPSLDTITSCYGGEFGRTNGLSITFEAGKFGPSLPTAVLFLLVDNPEKLLSLDRSIHVSEVGKSYFVLDGERFQVLTGFTRSKADALFVTNEGPSTSMPKLNFIATYDQIQTNQLTLDAVRFDSHLTEMLLSGEVSILLVYTAMGRPVNYEALVSQPSS